jgi:uncharacterized protein (TIGR02596 family)
MALKKTGRAYGSAGFTLVELMTVIAIGIIIAALSISSYSKVVAAGLLTTTTQSVVGLLDQARQTAISRNTYVEVRFYELPAASATATGAQTQWRAMQTFLVTNSGYTQLSKVLFFPSPLIIQVSPLSQSTLLNPSQDASGTELVQRTSGGWGTTTPPSLPTYGTNYTTIAFRFTPRGSLYLDATKQWFFTFYSASDKIIGATSLPANFTTIQVDGFSGKATYYRP